MKTGVYVIANCESGKVYIGSAAVSFRKRFTLHRSQLNLGKHHSRHLQASWDKYGESAFVFQPLEECGPSDAVRLEQIYIDAWKPAYNSSPTAGSVLGVKHSVEVKARRSLVMKAVRGTPEARARCSASMKVALGTPEAKARHSAASKASQARPEVKSRHSAALKAAHARPEDKARRSAALKAALGTVEARGCRSVLSKAAWASPEIRERLAKNLKTIHDKKRKSIVGACMRTGELMQFESLKEAARHFGCKPDSISKTLTGCRKSCHGYTWVYAAAS